MVGGSLEKEEKEEEGGGLQGEQLCIHCVNEAIQRDAHPGALEKWEWVDGVGWRGGGVSGAGVGGAHTHTHTRSTALRPFRNNWRRCV